MGQSLRVTFLTQAGALHCWDLTGTESAPFPLALPGVYYAHSPAHRGGRQARAGDPCPGRRAQPGRP